MPDSPARSTLVDPALPVDGQLAGIRASLSRSSKLVLQAPPGAGKTTRVPLALLDEPWLDGRKILLLEPRRLAARTAAERMAMQRNEPVGATVGYRIRLERRTSSRTRIEVLTEGILTRRLQSDPALDDVGLVIFDEFHERSLHADLGLALCLESQTVLRPDLRLLVMSATLDGVAVARLLQDAPVISASGRQYPVELRYLPRDPPSTDPRASAPAGVAAAVRRALVEQDGDILAFLPGGAEIRHALALLRETGVPADIQLLPLYGDLPRAEQQRALQAGGLRRVILASAIAETSLTIDGVSIVIDGGWARVPRFDPNTGLSRLVTERVSRDSAEQRAGRAGRQGPGLCYRLWSESTQSRLAAHRLPEMLTADLAPLALELALWGTAADRLRWLDPPPAAALSQAQDLLRNLGALDARGRITPEGRRLAEWPLHPRLAHMLLRGAELGLGALACDIAALLEERDPLRGDPERGCDLELRLEQLQRWRASNSAASADSWRQIDRAAKRLRRQLPEQQPIPVDMEHAVGLLLALAYPDRIARRREQTHDRYRLSNGRGARLGLDDPLSGRDWLVAAQLDAGVKEGRIQLAATVDLDTLLSYCDPVLHEIERIGWDEREQAVQAVCEQRLGALVAQRRPLPRPDPEQLRAAMLEGIRQLGPACLPWNDNLRQWQARVLTLRHWCPEEGWPDLGDGPLMATLADWLGPLDGITRREHLTRLDLATILRQYLGWQLAARLDQAAPTHLTVPSGSRIRLCYQGAEPPILAVKLQELFGLDETPSLNRGRIPVLLHLLSPARRPIQITRDLPSFWANTYPEVRRELKGRYPKHPWPEDPGSAIPTRGTRQLV